MTKFAVLTFIGLLTLMLIAPWFVIIATPVLMVIGIPASLAYSFMTAQQRQRIPRALVVDDDEASALPIISLLNSRRVDVKYVTSGREAVTELNNSNYDFLVLDLFLPDFNGDEVLSQCDDHDGRATGSNAGSNKKEVSVFYHTSSPEAIPKYLNSRLGKFVLKDVLTKGASMNSIRGALDHEIQMAV